MADTHFASQQVLAPSLRRPRILVVDDDLVNLQMIASIFEDDHDVFLADSAEDAMMHCRRELPDLLLLDILMPDADGLEVCRHLKADPATCHIPVIFITGQGSPREETQALNAGAVDFIMKPVNPAVVRARVKTHLTLKAQADILRSLAFVDGLTEVANRRRFDEYLEEEWRRGRRSGAPMTLIMADIDNFKHYNDVHGHPAGDACLQAVAGSLTGTLKRAQDLAARYGGEEFACVLPNTGLAGGRLLAQRMLEAVRALAIPHKGTGPGIVTISLGLASLFPSAGGNAGDLVALADAKLYEAKEGGRDRVMG